MNENIFMLSMAGLLATFFGMSYSFFGFTLDDAYITIRYGTHLAQGHGIVWNIGADPVEGYTSTLWMLLSAAAVVLGIDPVLTLKVTGIVATVATAVIVAYFGYSENAPTGLSLAGTATILLSPAIAVLAVQGMETTLAMLFISGASIATLRITPRFQTKWGVLLGASLLFGMLTRPEITVFAGGILLTLFGYYTLNGVRQDAFKLFGIGFAFLFLPGVVFVVTRWIYFGYPFPNSFYIKEAGGIISKRGLFHIGEFLTIIVGPLLALGISTLVADSESQKVLRTNLVRCLPLVAGIGLFLSVWAFISPIQGFLWRFQTPILPSILIVVLFLTRHLDTLRIRMSVTKSNLLTLIVILLLIGFPVHTYNNAITEIGDRHQGDRVQIGQSLSSLSDKDYKMVVTEAGAIPYYSQWTVVDVLGLNSEYIAHQGLSLNYLQKYSPDLIQILLVPEESMITRRSPKVAKFIENNDYRLVTVVEKSGQNTRYHGYFVKKSSPGYKEISCTLLETEGINRVSPKAFEDLSKTNVSVATITEKNCEKLNDSYILYLQKRR